jgi:hypothetical protein
MEIDARTAPFHSKIQEEAGGALPFAAEHLGEIVGDRADAGNPLEVGTDKEPDLALKQRHIAGNLGKPQVVGCEIMR